MGKNYCKVDKKWCRYLQRGNCLKVNNKIIEVNRCPRLTAIETVRLYDLLKDSDFEKVFDRLCHWFEDQEQSKDGYKAVYYKLLTMIPHKHNLSDLFINITLVEEDKGNWMNVEGKDMLKPNSIKYGIEFEPWNNWISMFITQETLDTFTKDEIIAGCLYEMTFFGFTEKDVSEHHNELIKSAEEVKKLIDKEKTN